MPCLDYRTARGRRLTIHANLAVGPFAGTFTHLDSGPHRRPGESHGLAAIISRHSTASCHLLWTASLLTRSSKPLVMLDMLDEDLLDRLADDGEARDVDG